MFKTNRYNIEIHPKSWVVPEHLGFSDWVTDTFFGAYDMADKEKKSTGMVLFRHQKFIKDFLQPQSPFRGIVLYHNLGVGKSCSAIATLEILIDTRDVIVMLPKGLRRNFINEMRKCGRQFFEKNQLWKFLPASVENQEMMKASKLPAEWFKKHKGMYVPTTASDPSGIPENEDITKQVNMMIEMRCNFVHYNGIDATKAAQLDLSDKCIIIDEVHNFISYIVSEASKGVRGKGTIMQEKLLAAQNAKIIALSGTPLINSPHEIAVLVNLLAGVRRVFSLEFNKNVPLEQLEGFMSSNRNVLNFSYSPEDLATLVELTPTGFVCADETKASIIRAETISQATGLQAEVKKLVNVQLTSHETMNIGRIHDAFPIKKVSVIMERRLPENVDKFNALFVNASTNAPHNSNLFMRRIQGTISFFDTQDKDLFPEVSYEKVDIPMTETMFRQYMVVRDKEIRDEERNRVYGKDGAVYKSATRQLCNFAFPEDFERHFMKKSDQDRQDLVDKLQKSGALTYKNLGEFSPKFMKMIDNIRSSDGTSMVYSDFREVEGVGILARAMEENGFQEFKVKRNSSGLWRFDGKYDPSKVHFLMYNTDDLDAMAVILDIFNNNIDQTRQLYPHLIDEDLKLEAIASNLKGQIIRCILLTKSGAEGISLKNVRTVHIMEPFWHNVRIKQVIGRAVRANSHIDLPTSERTVHVLMYSMTFSREQLEMGSANQVLRKDRNMTTDLIVMDIAKRKESLISKFLLLMQRAAVDCAVNKTRMQKEKEGITDFECFRLPKHFPQKYISPSIDSDIRDDQIFPAVMQQTWVGDVVKHGEKMLIRRFDEANGVYEYYEIGRAHV